MRRLQVEQFSIKRVVLLVRNQRLGFLIIGAVELPDFLHQLPVLFGRLSHNPIESIRPHLSRLTWARCAALFPPLAEIRLPERFRLFAQEDRVLPDVGECTEAVAAFRAKLGTGVEDFAALGAL